ncbi:ABC transporter permease [Ruegeria sp. HKCCD8929]|uniref:ABC transporter permease n=1 Tax=Ruegeria sp. HKCCD8929 TaxID=2683006 RepID=UPI00148997A8|nr:ABC transporter permease [Ruegeria sp. HKCCD8929]
MQDRTNPPNPGLDGDDKEIVVVTKPVWQRLLANPTAVISVLCLMVLVLGSVFANAVAGSDPLRINPSIRFKPPSFEFPFGTDNLGRDMFKIVLHGGKTSLLVGAVVTIISMTVATVLGLLAGYYRRVDMFLMRFVDGLMSFPAIVLATAMTGYLGPSVGTVVTSLSIVLIAPSLRVVRGQVLVVRELQMIEAARAVGVPTMRIFTKYILPAVSSPILVQASFIFSAAILSEAALSFIGLGIGSEDISWGNALTESRNYVSRAPWIVMFPGLALMLAILALNLLGDALRDVLDPKLARRR